MDILRLRLYEFMFVFVLCRNRSVTNRFLPFMARLKWWRCRRISEFTSSFSITKQKRIIMKLNLVIKLIGIGHVGMRRGPETYIKLISFWVIYICFTFASLFLHAIDACVCETILPATLVHLLILHISIDVAHG